MRVCLVLLAGAGFLAGCQSSKEPRVEMGKSSGPAARVEAADPKTTVRPVDAVRGRVVTVRDDLRFAIVDFLGGKLPVLDQELFVYRLDQKVARIKVSGPYRGTTAAVDIAEGDAKPGDLVRDR